MDTQRSGEEEEEEVLTVLSDFLTAMRQWEKSLALSQPQKNIKARLQAYTELEALFKRFCTEKERKKERESALRCEWPSEYEAQNQIIKQVEINNQQAFVYIEQPYGLKNSYRFCFYKQEGRWKIDRKEYFYPVDGKYYASFNACFTWKNTLATEQEKKATQYAQSRKVVLTENRVEEFEAFALIDFLKKTCLLAKDSLEVQQIGNTFDVYGKGGDGPLEQGEHYSIVYTCTDADNVAESVHVYPWSASNYFTEDAYPKCVVERGLEPICSGEIIMDVIELAIEQGKTIGKEPNAAFLLQAINYYLEYDDYLDFI